MHENVLTQKSLNDLIDKNTYIAIKNIYDIIKNILIYRENSLKACELKINDINTLQKEIEKSIFKTKLRQEKEDRLFNLLTSPIEDNKLARLDYAISSCLFAISSIRRCLESTTLKNYESRICDLISSADEIDEIFNDINTAAEHFDSYHAKAVFKIKEDVDDYINFLQLVIKLDWQDIISKLYIRDTNELQQILSSCKVDKVLENLSFYINVVLTKRNSIQIEKNNTLWI